MNLTKLMRERAEAVQAIVTLADSVTEAFRQAVELTAGEGGKTLAAPGFNAVQREILRDMCDRKGVELLRSPLRTRMDEIHAGLTFADWGIAETGSLVIRSDSEDIRLATMMSEVHVAMLLQSEIKAEVSDLEGELSALQASDPGYLAFITGPSRSGDIEMVLAVGVHGPRELRIIIIEE